MAVEDGWSQRVLKGHFFKNSLAGAFSCGRPVFAVPFGENSLSVCCRGVQGGVEVGKKRNSVFPSITTGKSETRVWYTRRDA
ncbi:hypothetical protein CYMTET_50769 [Cymbomonas tetramitiformis]|uniref:Uncharacterized protein n=1 Tax=Cymbomonas tetramitiformis TaxID=36881 RepID=A0AAE0ET38_9CHLO|nr:hypothetical protein CYMTET_50769 [Cymbomonas tetramitiformis]